MDDLSLSELQAALVSVQEKKATTRLSERNIVELVSKLQELGLLEAGLLHSIQGKDYITPEQLCTEIREAVREAGGRLAVADLPAQLGVDLVHCERQAEKVVQGSNGKTKIIQSEIMTEAYFDGVAAEVSDLLQDSGVVALGDMARRFKLSSELMQTTISARLGKAIPGHLEAGVLYTAVYLARIKAQLRGALRGAARPASLAALSKSLDLVAMGSSGRLVQSTVDELLADGSVSGSVKAGTFIPSIFAKAQQQAVQDFYAQNGFIEVEMLERMGVQDGSSYMLSAHPDSLALEAVFISPQFVAQLSAAVEDALLAGQWMDALTSVPSAMGPKDAASLLNKACPNLAQGKIMAATCVMSDQLLEDLREQARTLAREAAEAAIKARRASAKGASASAPATQAGGPEANERKQQSQTVGSDEDDWDTGRSSSKKKKGSRKKATAKQRAPANQQSKSKNSTPAGFDVAECLSLESLTSRVVEWLPEAAGAGEDGAFPEAVAAELRPAALAAFEEAQAAVFLAGAETRRRKRAALGKAIDDASLRYQVYAGGAEWVKDEESTSTALQRHILRTVGQRIADLLLRTHELEVKDQEEGPGAVSPDAHLQPVSASERTHLLSLLPSDVAAVTLAAEKALASTDTTVTSFKPEENSRAIGRGWEALQEAAGAAGVQLRKLDKKVEKVMLQEHRAMLTDRLKAEESPAEALSLAVPLLAAQVAGKMLSVPGKALGGVIAHLKGALPAEHVAHLSDFHKLVVEGLKSQGNHQNPRLLQLLPELKSMAGIADSSNSEQISGILAEEDA